MSTQNTVQWDRGGGGRKWERPGVHQGVRKQNLQKTVVFIGFGATFQIAFEKYTFLNRFEKYRRSYH